jgi:HEAT repeat protein
MRLLTLVMTCLALLALAPKAPAQMLTSEAAARRATILTAAQSAISGKGSDDSAMDELRSAMKQAATLWDTRRELLKLAAQRPGKALDAFLSEVLVSDSDSGVRGVAATSLGHLGAAEVLPALLNAAATDRKTPMMMGDVGSGSVSARRQAIFAVAELAGRFPAIQAKTVEGLRALTIPQDFENEHLSDVRQQTLFQITKDREILKPFLKKLTDPDKKVREDAVVAFRFFKLDKAPAELVAALKDSERDVRSWTATVLGEIADPQTIDVLKATAADTHEDQRVRANAIQSIGLMKRPETASFVEGLIADPDLTIRSLAAVAFYRITGKRVKEFPEGYNAD